MYVWFLLVSLLEKNSNYFLSNSKAKKDDGKEENIFTEKNKEDFHYDIG